MAIAPTNDDWDTEHNHSMNQRQSSTVNDHQINIRKYTGSTWSCYKSGNAQMLLQHGKHAVGKTVHHILQDKKTNRIIESANETMQDNTDRECLELYMNITRLGYNILNTLLDCDTADPQYSCW